MVLIEKVKGEERGIRYKYKLFKNKKMYKAKEIKINDPINNRISSRVDELDLGETNPKSTFSDKIAKALDNFLYNKNLSEGQESRKAFLINKGNDLEIKLESEVNNKPDNIQNTDKNNVRKDTKIKHKGFLIHIYLIEEKEYYKIESKVKRKPKGSKVDSRYFEEIIQVEKNNSLNRKILLIFNNKSSLEIAEEKYTELQKEIMNKLHKTI